MALSESISRAYDMADLASFPVAAGAMIYQGAALGEDGSGYARPLVAGDAFLGFSNDEVDNTGGADGDREVTARTQGAVELDVAGSSVTSNDGAAVYASDDGTFTLTAGGNSQIGGVKAHVSGTLCRVQYTRTLA